jgi:glyoxylase I family protein
LVRSDEAPGPAAGSPASGRNMDHVCLRVDPFDAAKLAAYFGERGLAPGELRTRFGAEGDGMSFYVNDPAGNRVELKGPPTGTGA